MDSRSRRNFADSILVADSLPMGSNLVNSTSVDGLRARSGKYQDDFIEEPDRADDFFAGDHDDL